MKLVCIIIVYIVTHLITAFFSYEKGYDRGLAALDINYVDLDSEEAR